MFLNWSLYPGDIRHEVTFEYYVE